jgi:hypothetical protein
MSELVKKYEMVVRTQNRIYTVSNLTYEEAKDGVEKIEKEGVFKFNENNEHIRIPYHAILWMKIRL